MANRGPVGRILPVVAILAAWEGSARLQESGETEELKLAVKVGRKPPLPELYNVTGFKPKPPLEIGDVPATAAELRPILALALDYLIRRQAPDGSWKYEPKEQIRSEAREPSWMFAPTAGDAMGRVVLTSLCGLALRSHEELAPERIRRATRRALEYVLDAGDEHTKERYGLWTWSFGLEFLAREYRTTQDVALRSRIRELARIMAERLQKDQHPGKAGIPKLPPRGDQLVGDPEEEARRLPPKGGYLGISISEDDLGWEEGVLLQAVTGPAKKAGLKPGDRVIELAGTKVEDPRHLMELIEAQEPDSTIEVRVIRRKKSRPLERIPAGKIPEDGGWSYYRMGGFSFATATAMLALIECAELGDFVRRDAIERGAAFLEASKIRRAGCREEWFAYRQGARVGAAEDVRGSVGRVAVCAMALQAAGRATLEEVQEAIEIFTRRRGELDQVLGYPGNHYAFRYYNAAYYFLYGHYYTARALALLTDPGLKRRAGVAIQQALLKVRTSRGTWVDHEAFGQVYGTAMALMALGELKFLCPKAYESSYFPLVRGRLCTDTF